MTFGSRLLSVCVVAGLFGTAGHVYAQEADGLRSTLDGETAPDDKAISAPSQLTITPEVEPQTAPRRRTKLTNPYAPLGIDLGGIKLFPLLQVDSVYSSNAAQASSNPQSTVGLHLKPTLRFESDWVRHSWAGQASGDITAYLKKDVASSKSIDLSNKFILDIRHDTHAEFDASYRLSQIGSEDSEVPSTAIGNRTDHTLIADAAITHDHGPLTGSLKLGLTREIFEDVKLSGGGTEDNADRNNYTPSVGLRLDYTDPPALKPFVDITYAPRFHDEKLDRNGLARDSQGVAASLGVTLDRGPIWSGEAAIVYTVRDYKDANLATNAALGINGNLTWKPTDLTSMVLTLATDLNETSSAASSGSRIYSSRVDVTHALRDNVNLLAGFGVSLDDDVAGVDKTITSKLGVEWQLNPDLAWTASYDGTWFDGATAGDNYNEQRISTGIILLR